MQVSVKLEELEVAILVEVEVDSTRIRRSRQVNIAVEYNTG